MIVGDPGDGREHGEERGECIGEAVPELEVPGRRALGSNLIKAELILPRGNRFAGEPGLRRLALAQEFFDSEARGVAQARGGLQAVGPLRGEDAAAAAKLNQIS